MPTLIAIQDEYVETLNLGIARWSHRKNGGHVNRIARGARRKAEKRLRGIGFNEQQISQIVKDARDMAELIRNAEVD
jgi:uncharacterized membrane protein